MPRKSTPVQERPPFLESLQALSESKGLTDEDVLAALEEATCRAYIKELGGGDDAVVTCHIDPETGSVYLAQVKKVTEEDDITDDFLQVSVEEANEGLKEAKYKVGDDFEIPCPMSQVTAVLAKAIKNNFRARLAEAERVALYRVYKDHIGEMMVGTVEKSDDKTTTISIGRTTIELTRKELIGDEYFRIGDQIKVYIQEVRPAQTTDGKPSRGPQIEATRSSEGFLKRLFEEEIHEIYDGTVLIKGIARRAGIRSKVAVASNNEDVDATGACIGQGGSRIQRIVNQLGNGKSKEKIDIINYSDNPGMFIIEAVRPAQAIGINVDEEDKEADVIIADDALKIAKGSRDINLNLAQKLTGYTIHLIPKSEADADQIEYTLAEDVKAEAEEEKKQKAQEELTKKMAEESAKRLAEAKKVEVKKAEAPSVEAKEEAVVKVAPKASAAPESFPSEAINPAAAALAELNKKKEEPVKEEPQDVKTTTTLSDLEKELEEAKEKKTKPVAKSKRPRKITEEEVKREPASPAKPAGPTMPVYTDEELSEIEEEDIHNGDFDDTEDDIEDDFSEYDRYYDDDGK